jgi:hypothetical protein
VNKTTFLCPPALMSRSSPLSRFATFLSEFATFLWYLATFL